MATPLNEGKSIAQKLHENLTWMRENGASTEEQHAEIAKAQAALDRQSATEKETARTPGTVQKVAEAVVSGLPGAQRAVAGYRGALSLAGVGDETPEEALAQQKEDVASLPGKARIPLQMLGGTPAAVLAAPLGVAGGGAAVGAAMGADAPAESIRERLKNTAVNAGVGAVAGKALQLGGRGIANIANRTGLTDKVAGVIDKISPKLGAASGTRGQVNAAFADRQDILDAIGDKGVSAGRKVVDDIANTKARAAELYGVAKQDTQAIDDPRVTALLNDPQVAKVMEAVSGIRSASGTPLPRVSGPETVPTALSGMGVPQARYEELMALAKQRGGMTTGVDILAPELKGASAGGVELPDPDALAKLKRYLYDAAQGRQDSPLNIKQDEARALMPKVDEIRSVLHEVSPAWKQADAFYADAKGREEAFAQGFDAFRHANNPSGEQLPTHTAEAMMRDITEPRYPNEPKQAMARRVAAFRDGVKASIAKGVRGSVVDENAASALRTPGLAPDQETQEIRGLTTTDSETRAAMEALIANKRGQVLSAPREVHIPESEVAYHRGPIRAAINALVRGPNRIGTPLGQGLIQQRQASRGLMGSEIERRAAGETLQQYLARLAAGTAAAQATRKP